MSRHVSLVVWWDARTDPPTGDLGRKVFVRRRGLPNPDVDVETSIWSARNVARDRGNVVLLWAEIPVVSDLTDDDVRKVAFFAGPDSRAFEEYALSSDTGSYHTFNKAVRAALGGEQEGA